MFMSRMKRLVVGAPAGMLCALALAAPGYAANVKATCVVNGLVKTSDKENPTIGVRLQGGKGHFFYEDFDTVCTGVVKAVADIEVLQTQARGVYDNVLCGTGKAWGTVTSVISEDTKYAGLLTGQKFAVHFLGFTGSFFWHQWNKPPVPDLKDSVLDPFTKPSDSDFRQKVKQEKEWQPAGVVQLSAADPFGSKPPRFFPEPDECTKAFIVSGVVSIDV